MFSKFKIALAAVLVVASASTALAAARHTSHARAAATLTEGRNAAVPFYGDYSSDRNTNGGAGHHTGDTNGF